MNLKRLLLATSSGTLVLGAALFGANAVQAAGPQSPTPSDSALTHLVPCDTTTLTSVGVVLDPDSCPATSPMPSSQPFQGSGTLPSYNVPLPSGIFTQPRPLAATAIVVLRPVATVQYQVSQDSFLNLVAAYLGTSRTTLNVAFAQATAAVWQTQTFATQEEVLNLVAQELGVSRAALNAALEQAGLTEVALLRQDGVLTAAQASAFDAAIASGNFALGLGFGIPGFSAPAV